MAGQRESNAALLGVLTLCVMSAQLGTSAVNVALPDLALWSGRGFEQAQWAVVAYLLTMTTTSLVIGYIADVVGRKRVLRVSLLVFVVASVACAVAPHVWALTIARVVQGGGAAAMTALPLALVRDAVAPDRSGAAMGLLGTAAAVGTAGGPAIGGILLGTWDWTAIFWAMIPLPALAFMLLSWSHARAGALASSKPAEGRGPTAVRRRSHRQGGPKDGKRFDVAGSAVLTGAVMAYGVAFSGSIFAAGWSLGLLVVVALLLALLVSIERRAARPLLPHALIRTRSVGLGVVLNLVVGAVMMSTLVIGPFYLSGALGLKGGAIGLAMAAGPVTSICAGVAAGRLVDRGYPGRLMTVGLMTMAVALLVLATLPRVLGLPGYLAGTVLLAPGYQLFMAANNTRVMTRVPPERRGTTSGILGLSRSLGLVTGSSAITMLFAAVAQLDRSGTVAVASASLDHGLSLVFGGASFVLGPAACGSWLADRGRA